MVSEGKNKLQSGDLFTGMACKWEPPIGAVTGAMIHGDYPPGNYPLRGGGNTHAMVSSPVPHTFL